MEIPPGIDGVPIDLSQIQAVEKGRAYSSLVRAGAYKLLVDFLESRSNEALVRMRKSAGCEDHERCNVLLIWDERERTLQEFQEEIQRGIEVGKEVLQQLRESSLADMDLPFNFGDDE